MTARSLVTTADERTWPAQGKILFLGGWCLRWERRQHWQGLDAVLAEPYGLGEARKDADHAYVRALEASIFPELCEVLGQQHGVSTNQRYWRIILGHWFRRYIEIIFNRTRTLQACIAHNDISSTIVLANPAYRLATRDSYSAIWASNDDRWNHALYARLIEALPQPGLQIETRLDESGVTGFRWDYPVSVDRRAGIRSCLRRFADRAAHLLQANDDVLILDSYLPGREALKLNLLLGQCPRRYRSNPLTPELEHEVELRRFLAQQITANAEKGSVEDMARTLLFELLPVCYLEAFASVKRSCEDLPWPSVPRAVFTSNRFDTDELFKTWLADKVLLGTKYVTGQHGNNYGTHRHHVNPSIEEITADRFLTWGWRDGLPQHHPAVLLKAVGRKAIRCDPAGGLLLVGFGLPHRLHTWDVLAEFERYFEDQKSFVRELGAMPFESLRIRLYPAHRKMGWGEIERWAEFDQALRLDDGTESIDKLIATSRLVVHSYDSTGILETLSRNLPTVAFWQNGLEHVRDSARPWFQLLIEAGIVHLSARSAATHVNNVWNDIAGWWDHAATVDARNAFCNQYARMRPHPLRELAKLLRFDR